MSRIKLLFYLLSLTTVFLVSALPLEASTKKVLILYDQGEDKRQPALTDARYLANLMGHFDTNVRLSPLTEYTSGSMDMYSNVFYVSYEKKFNLPESFRSDIFKTKSTFCWLNHQLGDLDQRLLKERFGFHFKEYREDLQFNKVIYKDMVFPKGDDNVSIVDIDDPSLAKVKAYAINNRGVRVPYIVNSGKFWFVADSPFSYCSERDRYIVFADLLHEIVGEDHPAKHVALVRIEDINPTTDPKSLLKVAKYLYSKNVPFAVALVPVYVDTSKRTEIHLEEKPKLLSVLKRIPGLGGSFVVHGYTHQYHGVSTDDYEFWDDVADKPVRGDSVDYASLRIEKALKECFSNDIYPISWETPHYFGSKNTYIAVKKYFSVTYERRKTMEYLGSDQFFPYPVKDIFGQQVIPENLGYIEIDNPDPQALLEAGRLNLAVRDGYASFFFHVFIDLEHLKTVVKGLKSMGYEFGDIKDFLPNVTAKDKSVLSAGRHNVRIDTQDKYISVKEMDYKGRVVEKSLLQNIKIPFVKEIDCPASMYYVVQPQEDLEPSLLTKIWRYAKTDLMYFNKEKEKKSYSKLNKIMTFCFIAPSRPVSSLEEKNDLDSLKYTLSVSGIRFNEINTKNLSAVDLRDYDIILIPYSAAKELNEDQLKMVREAVSSGCDVVFDGVTKLQDEFGIEVQQEAIPVKQIRDFQYPEIPLFWPKQCQVRPIYNSPDKEYKVLCVEEESNLPVVVSGVYGKGNYICMTSLFDQDSAKGYSRYPFLIEMFDSVFGYSPLCERRIAEMYFDPGMRQFISIEKLAKLWRRHGVNRIYAGGWHFYDKYTYDYGRLIRVCHENGIHVYCWLEPPMVNQKFWNKYPKWREKTALLQDAKVSWRYLMNFADENCRKKAFSEIETLLMGYDWDGVNVAELYFESPNGPQYPASMTPMNDNVRKEFKKLNGFDPLEIFKQGSQYFWKTNPAAWQKFVDYRKDLCFRQKKYVLDLMAGVREKKKDFELMLTVIDVTMEPGLADYISEDTAKLFSLQKKYDLTLQIEDPSLFWSGKPERYDTLGEYYKKYVKDISKLVLDCNVMDNHKKGFGGLPSEKPTGAEIRQITYNMDITGSRPAFYSEATLFENDYRNIGSILARDTVLTEENEAQWRVKTPYTVYVRTGKKDLLTKLDGEIWFAGEGDNVMVPAGEHVLSFESEQRYFDLASLKPKLLYLSGELKWANFLNNSVEFSYDSNFVPCYAIFNKRPAKIIVDSKKLSCQILEKDGGFSVKLPAGDHIARIMVGAGVSSLIEKSGVILLSLIIIFGFFTSVIFLGLFMIIQLKRKFAP